MRKVKYRLILALVGLLINAIAFAQTDSVTTTAAGNGDFMRSNNKIFVVMAVCITILVALILYLIRIDMKVTKLEKELQ
jgi:hypothetical protein